MISFRFQIISQSPLEAALMSGWLGPDAVPLQSLRVGKAGLLPGGLVSKLGPFTFWFPFKPTHKRDTPMVPTVLRRLSSYGCNFWKANGKTQNLGLPRLTPHLLAWSRHPFRCSLRARMDFNGEFPQKCSGWWTQSPA